MKLKDLFKLNEATPTTGDIRPPQGQINYSDQQKQAQQQAIQRRSQITPEMRNAMNDAQQELNNLMDVANQIRGPLQSADPQQLQNTMQHVSLLSQLSANVQYNVNNILQALQKQQSQGMAAESLGIKNWSKGVLRICEHVDILVSQISNRNQRGAILESVRLEKTIKENERFSRNPEFMKKLAISGDPGEEKRFDYRENPDEDIPIYTGRDRMPGDSGKPEEDYSDLLGLRSTLKGPHFDNFEEFLQVNLGATLDQFKAAPQEKRERVIKMFQKARGVRESGNEDMVVHHIRDAGQASQEALRDFDNDKKYNCKEKKRAMQLAGILHSAADDMEEYTEFDGGDGGE